MKELKLWSISQEDHDVLFVRLVRGPAHLAAPHCVAGVELPGPDRDIAQHHPRHQVLDGLDLVLVHLDLPGLGPSPYRGGLRQLLCSLTSAGREYL